MAGYGKIIKCSPTTTPNPSQYSQAGHWLMLTPTISLPSGGFTTAYQSRQLRDARNGVFIEKLSWIIDMNRWIWLILWTCVAGIWIADIVALFIVRPAFLSTWLVGLAYAWVPFSLVYIAQLVVTGRKVPFRV